MSHQPTKRGPRIASQATAPGFSEIAVGVATSPEWATQVAQAFLMDTLYRLGESKLDESWLMRPRRQNLFFNLGRRAL